MDYSYPILCASERYPRHVALVGREESVTYAELERRVATTAGGLAALGLGGRPVGMLMTNRPEAVEVQLALARAGCVAVPLNPRLSVDDLRFIARDCDLAAVVASDDLVDLAHEAISADLVVSTAPGVGVDRTLHDLRASGAPVVGTTTSSGDDAPATITYTSGTTGRPKGVVRSHRANSWNLVNSALGAPRRRDDVELFNLPVFGIGFVHFLLPALVGGATVVLDGAFDAERSWRLLEDHAVTRTFFAPTMIAAMLAVEGHEQRDLVALRTIQTAYAMTPQARERAVARFGEVFEYMYGLTEAQLTCATSDVFRDEPSNVGRTMGVSRTAVLGPDGTPVAPGEVGEVAFSGPSVMTGYHALPDETGAALRGEWVLTGDLGRLSASGELHYVGRSKEIIKTGGFSVAPTEVEDALCALDGVADAAVVGAPDDHWGEAVVAFLVCDDPEVDVADVLARCRARVAGFQTPKSAFVLEQLPVNATGKVDRARLRAMAAQLHR